MAEFKPYKDNEYLENSYSKIPQELFVGVFKNFAYIIFIIAKSMILLSLYAFTALVIQS